MNIEGVESAELRPCLDHVRVETRVAGAAQVALKLVHEGKTGRIIVVHLGDCYSYSRFRLNHRFESARHFLWFVGRWVGMFHAHLARSPREFLRAWRPHA